MNIGILGGTYDPVHMGHLHIAECARRVFGLDRVVLMVARVPPHKRRRRVSQAHHRYAMVALACAHCTHLLAGDWELEQPGPSYTVTTMSHFQNLRDGNRYCFIAGGDSLAELHLWRDASRLLSDFCFIFVQRIGAIRERNQPPGTESILEKVREVCDNEKHSIAPGRSYLVRSNPPPHSSTEIRAAYRSGGSPDPEALPPEVRLYIEKHRLYE